MKIAVTGAAYWGENPAPGFQQWEALACVCDFRIPRLQLFDNRRHAWGRK